MTVPRGQAYGLPLTGIVAAGLPPAHGATQPAIHIRHAPRRPSRPAGLTGREAVLDLPGGRQLHLHRGERTATFTGPPVSPDELVHPYVGAAAAVFSRWAGREVYHAGAFVCGGLAWAVLGGREAGKSSLLAALAARRLPVLADDLVVTDGHQAFCGPRTIDLRQPPPGSSEPVTRARSGSRWRLSLPPLPAAVPLGGWIHLRWQAQVAMPAVPASVLLGRLAAGRTWPGLPSDPRTLLALAARPGWDLGRPADWARLDEAVDLILATLPASPERHCSDRVSSSPAPAHPSRNRPTSAAAAAGVRPKAATSSPASASAVVQPASRSHSTAPEALSAW
jgi:hypothetical protein